MSTATAATSTTRRVSPRFMPSASAIPVASTSVNALVTSSKKATRKKKTAASVKSNTDGDIEMNDVGFDASAAAASSSSSSSNVTPFVASTVLHTVDSTLTPTSAVGSTLLTTLRTQLLSSRLTHKAPQMQSYMKSTMPYHGVASPGCKEIWKTIFTEEAMAKLKTAQQWRDAIRYIWDNSTHREERHSALALNYLNPYRTDFDHLPLLKHLMLTGGWWDYSDTIAPNHIAPIFLAHPERTRAVLLEWSTCEHMWLRRLSILTQLNLKGEQLDLPFLFKCISPSLSSQEFFLRKAIGWALRQVVRERPGDIVAYCTKNEKLLSKLSMEQALKHLGGSLAAAKKIMERKGGSATKGTTAASKKKSASKKKRKASEDEGGEAEEEEEEGESEGEVTVASSSKTKPAKRRKA